MKMILVAIIIILIKIMMVTMTMMVLTMTNIVMLTFVRDVTPIDTEKAILLEECNMRKRENNRP
jgi:hypothetical protein